MTYLHNIVCLVESEVFTYLFYVIMNSFKEVLIYQLISCLFCLVLMRHLGSPFKTLASQKFSFLDMDFDGILI